MSNQQKSDQAVETPSENVPAASDPKTDSADGASESAVSTCDGTSICDGSINYDS
jgi:hypothetical protein